MVKVPSVSQWPPETEWTINRDLLIVIAKKYCRPALSIVEWITSAFKSETTLIMCFGRRRSVLGLYFCWTKSFWKYCVRGQFEYGFQVLSKCHHWPVLDASFHNVLQNACFPWGVEKIRFEWKKRKLFVLEHKGLERIPLWRHTMYGYRSDSFDKVVTNNNREDLVPLMVSWLCCLCHLPKV